MTQAVYHAPIWLNTAQLITLNLPHYTLSTSFFATLLAIITCYKGEKKDSGKPQKYNVI